jgi:hypothetical protein
MGSTNFTPPPDMADPPPPPRKKHVHMYGIGEYPFERFLDRI